MAKRKKRCWGPEPHKHVPGCRPARPLCRWQAKVKPRYHVCACGVYWFPHRAGSGLCGNPEAAAERYLGPENPDANDALEPEGDVDLSFDVG